MFYLDFEEKLEKLESEKKSLQLRKKKELKSKRFTQTYLLGKL